MKSIRLVGLVLVVATWMGVHSSKAEAATAWSTNAAGCVPVGTFGVHLVAGAVTAGSGATVTLYCAITRNALVGAFRNIEITYRGIVSATSHLIQMSKATGAETVKCGIQSGVSTNITTQRNLCNNSILDFNNNFYYVRIVLKSGNFAGQLQTVYGSSLTSDF